MSQIDSGNFILPDETSSRVPETGIETCQTPVATVLTCIGTKESATASLAASALL